MKLKVEFIKKSIATFDGNGPLFTDYYLSIDKNPKINVIFKEKDIEITATMFVIRIYSIGEERPKVFHNFKLFSNYEDLSHDDLTKLFIDIYVKPNKDELLEAIDKAINKYDIDQCL